MAASLTAFNFHVRPTSSIKSALQFGQMLYIGHLSRHHADASPSWKSWQCPFPCAKERFFKREVPCFCAKQNVCSNTNICSHWLAGYSQTLSGPTWEWGGDRSVALQHDLEDKEEPKRGLSTLKHCSLLPYISTSFSTFHSILKPGTTSVNTSTRCWSVFKHVAWWWFLQHLYSVTSFCKIFMLSLCCAALHGCENLKIVLSSLEGLSGDETGIGN